MTGPIRFRVRGLARDVVWNWHAFGVTSLVNFFLLGFALRHVASADHKYRVSHVVSSSGSSHSKIQYSLIHTQPCYSS